MKIENLLDSNLITALATGLLVIVGFTQVIVLMAQKKQARLQLVTGYKKRWNSYKKYWGKVVFIGRNEGEFYQVLNEKKVHELNILKTLTSRSQPTVWAKESIQIVCGTLSEISVRILNNDLSVSDAYSVFGSEFLRHSKPLRVLLDNEFMIYDFEAKIQNEHSDIRKEMQGWLIYHDGIRRRSLILIDLLWAEAVRLEDLPPDDIRSAAESKMKSGKENKSRVFRETYRLNGILGVFHAYLLSKFLSYSEYKTIFKRKGICKDRLAKLNSDWTKRLLRE